jgi:hypothetical protein
MAKADGAKDSGPFAIDDAPMEIGELDLNAWLPLPGGKADPAAKEPPSAPQPPSQPPGADALCGLAVEVWRMKGRLARLREVAPPKELRPLESALAKMEEVLQAAAVEIDDPQGRPYHEGEPYEVLLFEPSPGLARPMVLQTVKPLVRVGGKLARRGEVVVGTPSGEKKAEGGAP